SAGLATRTAMVLIGSPKGPLQWLTLGYHRKGCSNKARCRETPGLAVIYRLGEALDGFVVELLDIFPVDQVVDEGLEILRTGVAVVDVVGVLPHVDAEDRLGARNERRLAVRGLRDHE